MSNRYHRSDVGYSLDRQQLVDLLQGLLHQVANAATVVEGASCALEETLDDDTRRELADDLHSTYADLNRLIERTRAAAGLLALRHAAHPVKTLVADASQQARVMQPAVVEDVHPETVWGDRDSLTMLLAELLKNAAEAAPNQAARVVARRAADPSKLELVVIDEGPGMSDHVKRKASEPFFSTRPRRGAGLGLAVARGIVAQHQGALAIETGERGTQVSALLPRSAAGGVAEPHAEAEHS